MLFNSSTISDSTTYSHYWSGNMLRFLPSYHSSSLLGRYYCEFVGLLRSVQNAAETDRRAHITVIVAQGQQLLLLQIVDQLLIS